MDGCEIDDDIILQIPDYSSVFFFFLLEDQCLHLPCTSAGMFKQIGATICENQP